MVLVFEILDGALRAAQWAVVVWVVSGWILSLDLAGPARVHVERLERLLDGLIEPVLRPARRLIPPAGGLDFSPLLLLLALFAARELLRRALLPAVLI